MTSLPGDPGPLRWLRFAFGFRLPPENVHWVRHELTDEGWRWRTVLRHLVVILPVCAIVVVVLEEFLPTPAWVSAMMVALILAGSVLSVATYADDIRAARRQGDEAAAARRVSVDDVQQALDSRDRADSTLGRATRPEDAAADAIVIDTSDVAAADVIAQVVARAEQVFA